MELTDDQKARSEANRKKALQLRATRLASHPYNRTKTTPETTPATKTATARCIDSGGGFLIEEEDLENDLDCEQQLVLEPPPDLDGDFKRCVDCNTKFLESRLLKQFDVVVCDGCQGRDQHKLITRTEAKTKYCLKDCDFDYREPVLKFLIRKNPHDEKWGEMKLYYEGSVKKRSMEVWGSEEGLDEQKEKLASDREKKKLAKFEKRVKAMKKSIRTSTWHKNLSKHVHEYDEENETYDDEEDMYSKKCKTCEHVMTYEKM